MKIVCCKETEAYVYLDPLTVLYVYLEREIE